MRISYWSSDVGSSDLAPGYAVFDLAAERRFEAFGLQWRGYARIANLFDREYVGSVRVNDGNGRSYEPAPGRGWVLGLRARQTFDRSAAGWRYVPDARVDAMLQWLKNSRGRRTGLRDTACTVVAARSGEDPSPWPPLDRRALPHR